MGHGWGIANLIRSTAVPQLPPTVSAVDDEIQVDDGPYGQDTMGFAENVTALANEDTYTEAIDTLDALIHLAALICGKSDWPRVLRLIGGR